MLRSTRLRANSRTEANLREYSVVGSFEPDAEHRKQQAHREDQNHGERQGRLWYWAVTWFLVSVSVRGLTLIAPCFYRQWAGSRGRGATHPDSRRRICGTAC
jgi:hypothetical protein